MPDFRQRLEQLLIICLFLITMSGCKPGINAPLLLVSGQGDYGNYTAEILKAEGFNEFDTISLTVDGPDESVLAKYPTVILSHKITDPSIWKRFEKYAATGGNLISVIPPSFPSPVAGLAEIKTDDQAGYLYIDSLNKMGKSFTTHRIQLHSDRSSYLPDSSDVIAWFGSGSGPSHTAPAVVIKKYKRGHTASFLYNLPANIVLTRQGNPLLAGKETDGIPGLRAMDLFTGGWVDTTCNKINQADEQMHLLSAIIEQLNQDKMPLPRLWYFPDTLKCLVTLTNDGEYRAEKDFDPQFRDMDSVGAKMSLYVIGTKDVSKEWVKKWTARGFEIAGHPDDTYEAVLPHWQTMDSVLNAKVREIAGAYELPMKTNVNHWFVWCSTDSTGKPEFAAQAQLEAKHGIGLEVNYAHYDNNSSEGHFLGQSGSGQGNYAGSGLPMRFTASDGKVIPVWQHYNNVYDQQYNEQHDPQGFFDCFKGLMDRSIDNGVYSYISVKSHNDEYYFSRIPLLKMISYATERGIPVWTAARLLEFVQQRDEAEFSDIQWKKNELSFVVNMKQSPKNGLTVLIPSVPEDLKPGKISIDNAAVQFSISEVRGKQYAFITVPAAEKSLILVNYMPR
jgi:hypothetical protein